MFQPRLGRCCSLGLPIEFANAHGNFLNVGTAIESADSKIALARSAKSGTRSNDDGGFFEELVEYVPAGCAIWGLYPDVGCVDAAEHFEP